MCRLWGLVVRDHGRSSEMAEQRVPNLQEMDEREAHRFLTDLYLSGMQRDERVGDMVDLLRQPPGSVYSFCPRLG